MTNESEIRSLMLLPPAADKCQTCACDHKPAEAHNRDSLYYNFVFESEHGRPPKWEDAVAHCSPEMQEYVRKKLIFIAVTKVRWPFPEALVTDLVRLEDLLYERGELRA